MVGTITTLQPSDFENGFICDCRQCPVALALKRNNYDNPVVDNLSIAYFNNEGQRNIKVFDKRPLTKNNIYRQ